MKTERNVSHLYADLLSDDSDQKVQRLVGDLHRLHAAPTPPHLNAAITRAIQQRVAERERQAAQRRTFLPRWLPRGVGAVAALLLAVILFGGGVYAIAPVLNRAFTQLDDAGLEHVKETELMHDLNLSQTIDGYTVHVQHAYADANRVMVGYTVQGPDQEVIGFQPNEMRLTTADGLELTMDRRVGFAKDDGIEGKVYKFFADTIQEKPAEVSLRLEIRDLLVYGKDAEHSGDILEPTTVVAGPFVFDFTVPFVAGKVVEVNQIITVKNVPVNLERIVITPSMTRAYLRLQDANGIPAKDWWPEIKLSGEGWKVDPYAGGGSQIEDDGRQAVHFEQALFDKHGDWTLTINKLFGHDPSKVAAATKEDDSYTMDVIEGPWEFRFVVP